MICDCLHINGRYADKSEIIREKVARFYFRGNYDVTPLLGMSISLLPKVLSIVSTERKYICNLSYNASRDEIRAAEESHQLEERKRCLNALFRMFKSIPDLSDVSSRDDDSSGLDTKRQRVQ